jgi:alpha-1,6-mannosyltransferase
MAVATAASWARFIGEGTLALDTHTPAHLIASGFVGIGLLASGICSLRLMPIVERLSWRALLGWALVLQAVAALALPLTSTDAYTSLAQGALERSGLSAYAHGPIHLGRSALVELVPPRWRVVPSAYGPVFLAVMRLVSRIGDRITVAPWGGLIAYKAMLSTSVVAALGLAAWRLRRREADGREVFTALALGPLLAWEIAGQCHNDGLLVLATLVFIAAAEAGHDALAAIAVALGMAVKIVMAPLLALHLVLVARRSPRRAAWVGAVALVVLATAYGGSWRDFVQRGLAAALGSEGPRHAHSLVDLVCVAFAFAGRSVPSMAYQALVTASAVGCTAALAWAAWRARTFQQIGRGYVLVLLTYFLTAAWFQPWYVSWALPLLVVEPDPRWRRLLAIFAIVSVVQWGLPLDPATTVAADAWMAWRCWRLLRDEEAAPAASFA